MKKEPTNHRTDFYTVDLQQSPCPSTSRNPVKRLSSPDLAPKESVHPSPTHEPDTTLTPGLVAVTSLSEEVLEVVEVLGRRTEGEG